LYPPNSPDPTCKLGEPKTPGPEEKRDLYVEVFFQRFLLIVAHKKIYTSTPHERKRKKGSDD
jgi:hypothetical protein